MTRDHQQRTIVAVLAAAAWLCVVVLPGAGAAVVLLRTGDVLCEAEDSDSNYGRMEWSPVPPGPRCVWTRELNGFAAEEEPSPIWSLWLVVVVALGLVAGRALVSALAAASSPPDRGPASSAGGT